MIQTEYKLKEEETRKTSLYERLTGFGMKTSMENFKIIYEEIKG